MDFDKVCAAITGLKDCFTLLETGVELKAQTGRLRNVLNGNDIDSVLGNTIVTIRKLNAELQAELSK